MRDWAFTVMIVGSLAVFASCTVKAMEVNDANETARIQACASNGGDWVYAGSGRYECIMED